jgi:hypothetical protein
VQPPQPSRQRRVVHHGLGEQSGRRARRPCASAPRSPFKLFFAEVRDRVLDSGLLDAATFDAASGLLDDPDYWTQCWMMTAVWARKPAA